MEDRREKDKGLKTGWLWTITAVLALLCCAAIYVDCVLGRLYSEQRKHIRLSAEATPVPVISVTPSPIPTPVPTRAPKLGDIENVSFPDYDTGAASDYSYQSDELKIAVNKVEDDGVTYYVADIWMRNVNCFRTAFSSGKYRGKRESAEKIAKDNNAILAVNGDFLSGLVIRNGELFRQAEVRATPTPDPDAASAPGYNSYGMYGTVTPALSTDEAARPERSTCVLYLDGTLATTEFEDFSTKKAMKKGAWQGWQFGPTLVRDSKPQKDVKKQGRSPRCILGYYQPGHYCLIIIDGRQKGYSIGMNFDEMKELCTLMGLKDAYNLDGGGSAIMVFNGEIINRPSGNGDARKLLDMIVIGEYLDGGELHGVTPSPVPTATTEEAGN